MTDNSLQDGEWLVERGIGETRALLVLGGKAQAMRIERDGGVRCGDILPARLVRKPAGEARGLVEFEGGRIGWIAKLAAGIDEGRDLLVKIVREPIGERTRRKPALVRLAEDEDEPRPAPPLEQRLASDSASVRLVRAGDREGLDAYGWSDLVEAAMAGRWSFTGGELLIEPTAALTAIDIDGDGAPVALARSAAAEAAHVIALFDLQGSIAIDFPSIADKAHRAEIGTMFDKSARFDCERTAINGFGLMHIVRRRTGPSLVERLQGNRVKAAALSLLRTAEKARGAGLMTLHTAHAVGHWLEQRPELTDALRKRTGRDLTIERHGTVAIDGGHVANESETH